MSAYEKYLRNNRLPHILCSGCGHGIIMGAITRAIEKADLDQDRTVVVSGIGCSSRLPGYMDFDTLHTTHGRALGFATGVKFAKPELNVIVIMGDGDALAIGGNHFIHACRRNINITTIILNNNVYGMTSGQFSPMTPQGHFATTAPYGNVDRNFDICELSRAAGATYVARGSAYHAVMLTDLITKAIFNPGFSVVEAISQCPTYYGRKNKQGTAVDMLNAQKENCVTVAASAKITSDQMQGKIIIGELHKSEAPEYTAVYRNIVDSLQAKEMK
ncbi:MAG: 2-oxoglutarate ferredoxin oxidoreductase subunit beta [Bacillota bacterium]|nr:MAG: 2-oxoglutarate ferredoxin oxidoreductase subunit beta [Bacillota bacterium]MBS3950572.1 2-oxoacid:ferredoxin oxidoreductase subunit beta [Peptococcaceae bacterium]